jgi:BNR repeat-like domain
MSTSVHRTIVLSAALTCLAVAMPTAVSADGAWRDPQVISGPTLLPSPSSANACGSLIGDQSWESGPTVAVDPTNGANLVAAWVQDYQDAAEVAWSHDGGAHWTKVVPPTTPCTGGPTTFGNGPTVVSLDSSSVGYGRTPDGRHGVVYLASMVTSNAGDGLGGIIVNRSLDGGRSWSQPTVVDTSTVLGCAHNLCAETGVDGVDVIADPQRPGYAYMIWGRVQIPSFAVWGQYVSRTTDGGRSWSTPVPIPTVDDDLTGTIRVLPDGSLIALMETLPPQTAKIGGVTVGPTMLSISRSTDQGATWSRSIPVAVLDPTDNSFFANAAEGPTGTLYVSWISADPGGASYALQLISSSDGGASWSLPATVRHKSGPPESGFDIAAAPNIAVSAAGTVCITYYDHRNDPDGTNRVTDYWAERSQPDGSWAEDLIAGPFDRSAANSPGSTTDHVLGNSQGLVAWGSGFAAVFTLSAPLPGGNFQLANPPKNTDVFFSARG